MKLGIMHLFLLESMDQLPSRFVQSLPNHWAHRQHLHPAVPSHTPHIPHHVIEVCNVAIQPLPPQMQKKRKHLCSQLQRSLTGSKKESGPNKYCTVLPRILIYVN
jgi:hypothetical protein